MSEEYQKALFAKEALNTKVDSGILMTDLTARRGTMKKVFKNLGLVSAELPLSEIRALAQSKNVALAKRGGFFCPTFSLTNHLK